MMYQGPGGKSFTCDTCRRPCSGLEEYNVYDTRRDANYCSLACAVELPRGAVRVAIFMVANSISVQVVLPYTYGRYCYALRLRKELLQAGLLKLRPLIIRRTRGRALGEIIIQTPEEGSQDAV